MIDIIKKYNYILDKKQKIQAIGLIFLMVIGSALETLGVSMVLPLVETIMKPDIMETSKIVNKIANIMGITTNKQFTLFLLLALIVVFLSKNAFFILLYYAQAKFICNARFRLQKKLVNAYLHRPYDFFLEASTADVMRIISGDAGGTFYLLTSILELFTEALVGLALAIVVFVIEPLMASVLVAVLFILALFMVKFVKPKLKEYGAEQMKNNTATSKWLMQFIAGIKEIKIIHKEQYFEEQYSYYGKKTLDIEKLNSILSKLPRLLIESVSICGILLYFVLMIIQGYSIAALIPQLSAFVVAAVRLLPCANRISAHINQISFYEPQLNKIFENIKEINENQYNVDENAEHKRADEEDIIFQKSIAMKGIVYAYPNSKSNVLNKCEMIIPKGKAIGVVGTSGAGKTTAVDIILGLLKPQQGEVLVDELNIEKKYTKWLTHIGYIPQTIYMLDDTIKANVAFGYSDEQIDIDSVWKALSEAQLDEFVRQLPAGLDTEIGERGVRLSGGQRQRIGIARALYTNADVLVFDEATSALDNETEAAIMESINSLHGRKTMIIIAHRLQTIEKCDIVYRIEDGKAVQDIIS